MKLYHHFRLHKCWFDDGQQLTKSKHMKEFEMSCGLSNTLDPGFSKMLLRWRYFLYPCNVKRDWIIGSRWPNSYHNPVARMSRIYVAFFLGFLGKSNRKNICQIFTIRSCRQRKITEFVFFIFSHRMSVLGHQEISRRYVNYLNEKPRKKTSKRAFYNTYLLMNSNVLLQRSISRPYKYA